MTTIPRIDTCGCAVRCGAHAIVSDNVKHFPKESLAAYGLECLTRMVFWCISIT